MAVTTHLGLDFPKQRRADALVNPAPSSFQNYQKIMAGKNPIECYNHDEWNEFVAPLFGSSKDEVHKDTIGHFDDDAWTRWKKIVKAELARFKKNNDKLRSLTIGPDGSIQGPGFYCPPKSKIIDNYMDMALDAKNGTDWLSINFFSKKEAEELLALPADQQRAAAWNKCQSVVRNGGINSLRAAKLSNEMHVTATAVNALQATPSA